MATGGDDDALALGDHVGDDLALVVEDDGTGGHLEDEILTPGAVAVVTRTVGAAARLEVRVEVEVQQGVDLGVDLEDDVATVAAVAAVRTAERDELLAVDRGAAVAAVAGLQVQDDSVDEAGRHWWDSPPGRKHRPDANAYRVSVPRVQRVPYSPILSFRSSRMYCAVTREALRNQASMSTA